MSDMAKLKAKLDEIYPSSKPIKKKKKNVEKKEKKEKDETRPTVGWILKPADHPDDEFRDWIFGENKHPESLAPVIAYTVAARDAHVKRMSLVYARGFERKMRRNRKGLKFSEQIIVSPHKDAHQGRFLIKDLKFNEWCGVSFDTEALAGEFIKFLKMIKGDMVILDDDWLIKRCEDYGGAMQTNKSLVRVTSFPVVH